MHLPEVVEIKRRRTMKGAGALSGVHVNAPNGEYQVLGVGKSEAELVAISKGRLYARILSIRPGLHAVIEPLVIGVPFEEEELGYGRFQSR
jgi:hypothetical protein